MRLKNLLIEKEKKEKECLWYYSSVGVVIVAMVCVSAEALLVWFALVAAPSPP
jgi:hypothetical protein